MIQDLFEGNGNIHEFPPWALACHTIYGWSLAETLRSSFYRSGNVKLILKLWNPKIELSTFKILYQKLITFCFGSRSTSYSLGNRCTSFWRKSGSNSSTACISFSVVPIAASIEGSFALTYHLLTCGTAASMSSSSTGKSSANLYSKKSWKQNIPWIAPMFQNEVIN